MRFNNRPKRVELFFFFQERKKGMEIPTSDKPRRIEFVSSMSEKREEGGNRAKKSNSLHIHVEMGAGGRLF
jgi:hypothetical protein